MSCDNLNFSSGFNLSTGSSGFNPTAVKQAIGQMTSIEKATIYNELQQEEREIKRKQKEAELKRKQKEAELKNNQLRQKIVWCKQECPWTIVKFDDGEVVRVKCGPYDDWDPEKGFYVAIARKYFNNKKGILQNQVNKWVTELEDVTSWNNYLKKIKWFSLIYSMQQDFRRIPLSPRSYDRLSSKLNKAKEEVKKLKQKSSVYLILKLLEEIEEKIENKQGWNRDIRTCFEEIIRICELEIETLNKSNRTK